VQEWLARLRVMRGRFRGKKRDPNQPAKRRMHEERKIEEL
jgi:hypothetical protein